MNGAQLNAALRGRTGELPTLGTEPTSIVVSELRVDPRKTRLTSKMAWEDVAGARSNSGGVSIG